MVRIRMSDLERLLRPSPPPSGVVVPLLLDGDISSNVGDMPNVGEDIVVELLGRVPLPKERHRMGPRGAYTTTRTSVYEREIASIGRTIMAGREPMRGPIRCMLEFGFPIPASWPKYAREEARLGQRVPIRKADWDNLSKAVTDALNDIVYIDDAQIVESSIRKVYADIPFVRASFARMPDILGGWKSGLNAL